MTDLLFVRNRDIVRHEQTSTIPPNYLRHHSYQT